MLIDFEKFERDMTVFSFKQHQDVLTYLIHLKDKGWTLEDAKRWVTYQQEKRDKSGARFALLNCPLCQSPMRLLSVNIDKSTQTGDDSKSVWLCPKKDCLHAIYNKETTEEIVRKGGT